jgi:hypothetical protein
MDDNKNNNVVVPDSIEKAFGIDQHHDEPIPQDTDPKENDKQEE